MLYIEALIANGMSVQDAYSKASVDVRENVETLSNWRERMKSPHDKQYRPSSVTAFSAGKYFDAAMERYNVELKDERVRKRLLDAINEINPAKR